jgi:ankyrin repeat protein
MISMQAACIQRCPVGCACRAALETILDAYLCRHSARASSASSDSLGHVVNARDSEGRTPLYIACQFGHVECARFLVGNGAKRLTPDHKGNTPLHVRA